MAGIRQIQFAELDPGLGVVWLHGGLGCKPFSIHIPENCFVPVFSTDVPWPSGRPAQIPAG